MKTKSITVDYDATGHPRVRLTQAKQRQLKEAIATIRDAEKHVPNDADDTVEQCNTIAGSVEWLAENYTNMTEEVLLVDSNTSDE